MKAIIFDFDGTLANTLPICFYAFQQVFEKYDQKKLTSLEIVEMFGPSETGIIKENLTHPDKESAIEYFYEKYSEQHKKMVENNSEILEMLKFLKKNDMKIGIFTGKARRSLDISLKVLGMDGMFDVIITGDDVLEPKPHPEGLLKSLSILGVHNSEAIYIGDSDADVLAGVQANVLTIGVQWLPEYQTSTFSEQPTMILNSVDEFINFLKVGSL